MSRTTGLHGGIYPLFVWSYRIVFAFPLWKYPVD